MSNFERELEQHSFETHQRTAKQLIHITDRLTPSVLTFSHIDEHERRRDERYIQSREKSFANGEESTYHAKALESLMMVGIAQGRWFNDPSNDTYRAEPIFTTRLDDISNRLDAAATVHANAESNNDHETADLTFGIDLTTSSDPSTIRDKLLISSNNPDLGLPVGFTEMKYYRDRAGVEDSRNIPRYCIGISRDSIDGCLDKVTIRPDGSILVDRSADNITQFKILYEMSLQNGLYEAPLIQKDEDESISEDEAKLLHRMELLDNIYLHELGRVAKRLPLYALQDGAVKKNGAYDYEQIAKNLVESTEDRTFAAIVHETQTLTDEFYESDDVDHLQHEAEATREAKRRNRRYGSATLDTAVKVAS